MLFYPTISVVAANLKNCRLKSSVLSSVIGCGQLVMMKSIHYFPLQSTKCEVSKLSSAVIPSLVFTRPASRKGKGKNQRPDPPTDFLPFPWERRQKFNQFEKSGDYIKTLEVDSTLPKYDLDLEEILKGLDDNVRKLFTLETGTIGDLREISRQIMLRKVQQHPMDFDSREVKIGLETLRIRALFYHCQRKPKHSGGRVLLYHAIHRRNKMLKHLFRLDTPRFEWIVKELNIDYTPFPFGVAGEPYSREGDLRRLTKEYCEKLISEKHAAHHAKLKEQQQLFAKEKEEILAWIAEEEKDLGISKT